ncbi:hypothetical protein A3Q56_07840 [Intoshia linei]|uniref:Protein RER1 n=1 Tax=Intoshia linei TaxID=1819745 RepID=A0A177AR25_9BILA|nr:hypothetical protein A3Q56_07840 [Intoshia linei]
MYDDMKVNEDDDDFFEPRSHFVVKVERYLDLTVSYLKARWTFTFVMVFLTNFNVIFFKGHYVVAYTLGIYLLNLLLQFLSPKIDPALSDDDGPTLPMTEKDEEFKPFIRRLDEFNCWKRSTMAVVIGYICTFIPFFNIPVFWPILLIYFCILFTVTMKRQIMHMIKYKYIPMTIGKQTYNSPVIDN